MTAPASIGSTLTRNVLIAEDDPRLRRLLLLTLASEGDYGLHEARDGDQAWALLQTYRPAVAVLDVRMPSRTGLELVQAIKKAPSLAGTYVILLTAQASAASVQAARAAGVDLYVTKPFSPLELLTAVDRGLDAAGVRDERGKRWRPVLRPDTGPARPGDHRRDVVAVA